MKHRETTWPYEYHNSDAEQWYAVGPAIIKFGWDVDANSNHEKALAGQLMSEAPELLMGLKDAADMVKKITTELEALSERIYAAIDKVEDH